MPGSFPIRIFAVFIFSLFLAIPAFAAIDVNKSFSPATRYPTEITRITVELQNSATSIASATAFTDILPDGVFVASVPNLTNTCGGVATPNNTALRGEVALTGGIIPAGDGTNPGVCKVSFDAFASGQGTFVNSIPVGDVTATVNGLPVNNIQASQASLTVVIQEITGSISTDVGSYLQGNETTRYHIRLTNPNPVPLTNVSFIHDMNAQGYNYRAIDNANKGTTCGTGTIGIAPKPPRSSAYGPTSEVTFASGTIPANATCDIFFDVEIARDPTAVYASHGVWHRILANSITSTEGATNTSNIQNYMRSISGIRVTKRFNNSSNSSVNLFAGNTATLTIDIQDYNAVDIDPINLTDVMPAGLTVNSITSNTCGGTTSNTANDLTISNGALSGATAGQSGLQAPLCRITAVVGFSAAGTYINDIPAGTQDGHSFSRTVAILNVSGASLSVSKGFKLSYSSSPGLVTAYQGDTIRAVLTLKNETPATPITNVDFDDLLTTMGAGFTISPNGVMANSCGGTVTAPSGGTTIQFRDLAIPGATTCTVEVELNVSSQAFPVNQWRRNTIPSGDITFQVGGGASQVYGLQVQGQVYLRPAIRVFKYWSPATVGPLGISRARIRILRYSTSRTWAATSTSGIDIIDTLPAGHVVAATPNVTNSCGGAVTAASGTNTIQLVGGALPSLGSSSTKECSIYVNVQSPPFSAGGPTESATNTIPGDANGTPTNFSAINDGDPTANKLLQNYFSASAVLTRQASAVSMSKEFRPATINGGGVSRVRFIISNLQPTAINLTNLGMTDTFPANLFLHTNIDPKFTDTSGNPNANGCSGGTFTGVPGGTSITMTGGQMNAGTQCWVEFNVTSVFGGNHVNTFDAGDLTTNEGISNNANISATLTVARNVQIGKGFSPSVIGAGEASTLRLEVFNSNLAGTETGTAPALVDVMPSGVQITGAPTTNCAGATVTNGVNGAGLHTLTLSGGTYPGQTTCEILAPVTASATGNYVNTIGLGDLTMVSGVSNPDPATATLIVSGKPTITKQFSPTSIAVGATSSLRLRVYNPNNAAILPTGFSGVSFTDTLTNMVVASPATISTNCSGLVHNVAVGATALSFSGISIPPSGNCFIYIPVTSTQIGTHPNQTSGADTNQTSSPGTPSNSANLTVLAPVTMAKTFSVPSQTVYGPVTMTVTLSNPNSAAVSMTINALTDNFPFVPGAMVVAPTPNAATSCPGSRVRNLSGNTNALVAAGDTGFKLHYGSIPANGSCTVTVDVTSATPGAYTNTTGALTSAAGTTPPASANVAFTPGTPGLQLSKTVSGSADTNGSGLIDAGDTVSYTFVVTNTGNLPLTNITVTDPKATMAGGPIASLAPSGTDNSTFTATYVLQAADITAGGVENTALVTGSSPSGTNDVTDVSDSGVGNEATETPNLTGGTDGDATNDPTVFLTQISGIQLTKTISTITDVNSNGINDAGDIINYAFAVTNTGNVTLTPVTVADAKVTMAGSLATLGAGLTNTAAFTATYTILSSDMNAGGVENTATATGTPPPPPSGGAAVPVTDVSDAGNEAVETPALNGSTDGDPTNDPTVQLLAQTGGIKLTKTIGSVTDTNGNSITDAGDVIHYVFTVENTGVVTLAPVTITDPKVSVVGTLASLAAGAIDNSTFTATYAIQPIDVNAGGVENTATASGTPPNLPDGSAATPVTDVSDAGDETTETPGLTGTTDGDPTNDPTVQLIAQTGGIRLTKTISSVVDTNGNGITDAGDTINYAFSVTNTGIVTLAPVTISDPKVTVAGSLASLAAGATDAAAFTASYVILPADMNAGGVDNTAIATGTPPNKPDGSAGTPATDMSDAGDETTETPSLNGTTDGDPTNDPTVQLLAQTGGIQLTKTISSVADTNGNGITDAGDTINYAFSVTNTGVVTLAPVTITDAKVTVAGTLASLAAGATDAAAFTASYVIQPGDFDAGGVENTATATGTPPNLPDGSAATPVTDISDAGNETTETPALDGTTDGDPTNDPTIQLLAPSAGIQLTKTISSVTDTNGNGITDAGDTINYAFAVTNTGNVTLAPVTIADPKVTVAGTLASLAPGATDTSAFTASYIIQVADADAGGVENTATATGTPPNLPDGSAATPVTDISDAGDETTETPGLTGTTDGDPTNDPTVQLIAQSAVIQLTKVITGVSDTNGNGVTDAGDTINYAFTLTNAGNVTLTNINVNDPLVSVVSATGSAIASLAPGASDSTTFTAGYVITPADVTAGGVQNSADTAGTPPNLPNGTPVAPVTDVSDPGNETGETGDLVGGTDGDPTNDPTLFVLGVSAFSVPVVATKVVDKTEVKRGETVTYTLQFTTVRAVPIVNVTAIDELPAGVVYIAGTATVNGGPLDPIQTGQTLSWPGQTVSSATPLLITFDARVVPGNGAGTLSNTTHLFNPATGATVSNVAAAVVRIIPEHVFDCSDVIGKVFDDVDIDGYQGEDEPGLPGVRLATISGVLITTDEFGRFNVPCAELPAATGSNFLLKLDTRSLPSGYRVTTENPRVIRLTAGKIARLNFGAALTNVIDIDLTASAFVTAADGTIGLSEDLKAGIASLIAQYDATPSVIRLSYFVSSESTAVARARTTIVEKLLRKSWPNQGRYRLLIERTIKRLQ